MASTQVDWNKCTDEQEKLSAKVSNLNIEKQPAENASNNTESKNDDGTDEQITPAEKSFLQKIIRKGLVVTKKNIEIQRKDPASPLYSVKTFEALHLKPALLKGVYAMGFNAPSKIQETALPTLLADPPQNMIAQSQSGTGKTAAFVLAMLSRVDTSKNYPQVLCLSPTYELAIQTGEVAAKMSAFCNEIKIKYAVRGEEVSRGSKITEHIIIGTPGKVLDWTVKFKFFNLSEISVFVLDEADVMIATQGHQDQCIRIHKQLPRDCQMMFFSATYEPEVMKFAEIIVNNPLIIRLLKEEESLDNIEQYYVKCKDLEEKYAAITNIYGVITIGQAIIFCHTRKTANWLAEKMTKDGHAVAVLSGELTVEQRISVLDRFREGLEKVLITTNVLARGIDVQQVTIVVNFDLPMDQNWKADCETYLHRIGRTGRFGKSGIAINLVDSSHAMAICKDIETHFGKKIRYLNVEDADEIEKIGA
ncbi:putative ATP-dependent RNA helicase Dbp80 [Megalopta genalis]|uniref:putative ATP-dependent RNA helicase Dbp80 n=1 Tax=Megalopta genalis TaxID=115081 RepID=UPI001443752B|nr:DEAD-box helicase Dbp80 [Megalopta genalis]